MLSVQRELSALKFVDGLSAHLKDAREPHKALRHALRDTRDFFRATQGCIATLRAGRSEADVLFTLPKQTDWDLDVLTRYIRHMHPPVQRDMLIGSVRRRGGAWGAMALVGPGRDFDREDRRLMTRIAAVLSAAVHRIDRDRLAGVRDRIDRKIMEQIHPKDLFYQIFDGIRSLTLYDHSSALLIREENEPSLRVVAEQIAWTKAKSERIGLRIPITDDTTALLQSERVYGFDRQGESWREWTDQPAGALAALLDYNHTDNVAEGENVREASMLCAPLVTRDGLVGVLKIAARYPEQLKPFDAELVEHFRSQAAIAIQNLHRTESLRARVLTAERKHAMADLARSVSHDLNNALGAMLPLIQQMQADLRSGALAPNVFAEDLEHVQKSLQVCRRIFGGMLTFSRNAARRSGYGQVRRAIETASAILKYGMSRSAIELHVNVPDDIPEVACSQSDLEQVFLNLLTNAREATPRGGRIMVTVRSSDRIIEISVADTGCGIPEENLPRVLEPFFTTKPHGSGLGLSICRSVLWEVDGTLTIHSEPGNGTDVRVLVPQAVSLEYPQVS
ncbi:MAG TPA: ATP-binding protein [Vicinamibacterales bacterium]|nr:ATP-binding protein [Vicinamibacterales bacterium]